MSTFEASTAYVEPLSRIFKAVGVVAAEGEIILDESGIKVQVTDSSQAFAAFIFLPPEMFASYLCSEQCLLKLNLATLALCLKMYVDWSPLGRQRRNDMATNGVRRPKRSAEAQCVFQYAPSSNFELRFSHDSMTSVCVFSAFADPTPSVDIVFDAENVLVQAIMPGGVFERVLHEFVLLEADQLTIRTSKAPSRLHFAAPSDLAATELSLQIDSDVLSSLNIEEPAEFRYNFKSVCRAREMAKIASQASLRFDSQGVLSTQLIYEFDDQKAFVEFRFLPLAY